MEESLYRGPKALPWLPPNGRSVWAQLRSRDRGAKPSCFNVNERDARKPLGPYGGAGREVLVRATVTNVEKLGQR